MKPLLAFLFLSALFSQFALAQRGIPVGVGGFGNVLHPGGVTVPLGGRVNLPALGFGNVYGAYGARGARSASNNRGGGGYAGYPVYVGGAYVPAYGSSSYAPDYSSQTQLSPQQQYPPAPPVVINQYFGPQAPPEPVTGVYQPYSQRQPPQDQSVDSPEPTPTKYYLLAFKDHSVYSALAYWVEDKTLHYVTPQNSHNQASLDLVDVDFTKQLNQDQTRPFSIETPSK